jgi:zinc D-Ala-D-Ala carboxypeptidase
MTQLTAHFSVDELTFSQTAIRKGISNEPTTLVLDNLKNLAETLERVRTALDGHAISISSGYRSPKLNLAIGGVKSSSHVFGYAADFICPAYGTPRQVADAIAVAGIKFDQLIEEGTWVHISIDPKIRGEYLRATFKNGKANYTKA